MKYYKDPAHGIEKKRADSFILKMARFYTTMNKDGTVVDNFKDEFDAIWKTTMSDPDFKNKSDAEKKDLLFAQQLKLARTIYKRYLRIAEIKRDIDTYICNVCGAVDAEKLTKDIFGGDNSKTLDAVPETLEGQQEYLAKLKSLIDKIGIYYSGQKDFCKFGERLLARKVGLLTPYDEPANDLLWSEYSKNLDLLEKGLLTYQVLPDSFSGQVGIAKEVKYSLSDGTQDEGLLVNISYPSNDPFLKEFLSCLAQDQDIRDIIQQARADTKDDPEKILSNILSRYGGRLPASILKHLSLTAYSPKDCEDRDRAIKAAIAKSGSQSSVSEVRQSLEAMTGAGKKLILVYVKGSAEKAVTLAPATITYIQGLNTAAITYLNGKLVIAGLSQDIMKKISNESSVCADDKKAINEVFQEAQKAANSADAVRDLKIYYFENGSFSGPVDVPKCFEMDILKPLLVNCLHLGKDPQTDTDLVYDISGYKNADLSPEENQPAEFLGLSFKLLEKTVDKDKGGTADEDLKMACNVALQVISDLLKQTSAQNFQGGLIKYMQGSIVAEIKKISQENLDEVLGQLDRTRKENDEYLANIQTQSANIKNEIKKQKDAAEKQKDAKEKELRASAKKDGGTIDEKAMQAYLKQYEAFINKQVNGQIMNLNAQELNIKFNIGCNLQIIKNNQMDLEEKKKKIAKISELGGFIAQQLIDELGLSSAEKLDQNSLLSAADQILGVMTKNYASLKDVPLIKDQQEKEYLVIDGTMAQSLLSENANMSHISENKNEQDKAAPGYKIVREPIVKKVVKKTWKIISGDNINTISLNPDKDHHEVVEELPILSIMLYLADQGYAPNPIHMKGKTLTIEGTDYLSPAYLRALANWQDKLASNSPYKQQLDPNQIRAINRVADYVQDGRFYIDEDMIKNANESVILKNGETEDVEATEEANQVLIILRRLYNVISRVTQEAEPKQEREYIADQEAQRKAAKEGGQKGSKSIWQKLVYDFLWDPIHYSLLTMPTPANRKALEAVDNTRVIGLKEILFKKEVEAKKNGTFFAENDDKPCHAKDKDYFQGESSISIGWDFIQAFVKNYEGYLTPAAVNAMIGTKSEKADQKNEQWALDNPKEFLNSLAQKMKDKGIVFNSLYFNVNDDQRLKDLKIQVGNEYKTIKNPITLGKRICKPPSCSGTRGKKAATVGSRRT